MFKPLNDHVLVKRLEQESVSKGGIIIPDTAKEKPAKGRVIAVGSGKLDKAVYEADKADTKAALDGKANVALIILQKTAKRL